MMKRYKIVTEHGISKIVFAEDAATARNDFKLIMPGVKLTRIQLYG